MLAFVVGLTVRAHIRRKVLYRLAYVKLVDVHDLTILISSFWSFHACGYFILTAWPEEEVLGLSIDYSDDWICWPASNLFQDTFVMIGFDVVLFPSCLLVNLIWPACAQR